MPSLQTLFSGYEPDMIHIIARHWGVDATEKPVDQIKAELTIVCGQAGSVHEVLQTLPAIVREAFDFIVVSGGRVPTHIFSRRYGEIREMGAAKRSRDHPDENPISPSETLWYTGLIGKAFFDETPQAREYVYIADEILKNVPRTSGRSAALPGRPALPEEHRVVLPASGMLMNDACTLLAGLRKGKTTSQIELRSVQAITLLSLLKCAKVVAVNDQPESLPTRSMLEKPQGEALLAIVECWRQDKEFNELSLVAGLILEGTWRVDMFPVRTKLLSLLGNVPSNTWWSIASVIEHIHTYDPDFLRPEGDYDSWFIRDTASGEYLRGASNWPKVEGRLVHFFISHLLHALGLVDIGARPGSTVPVSFRWSSLSDRLLDRKAPIFTRNEARIKIDSKGRLAVPLDAPLTLRYLLSRYAEWGKQDKGDYQYQLTARSLQDARKNSLKPGLLNKLLVQHSANPVPPTLMQALQGWEKIGIRTHIRKTLLLTCDSPDVIKTLQNGRARRFLGEQLNPNTITIKPGGERIVQEDLLELGYFSDCGMEE